MAARPPALSPLVFTSRRVNVLGVAIIAPLLNFIYPPRCAACGRPFELAEERHVCARCLARAELVQGPLCAICGAALDPGSASGTLCARCTEAKPAFAQARSIARYRASAEDDRSSLAALIRRHKYGLDQSLHRALAEFLEPGLPYSAAELDLVLPVPLHPRRLWWRGFNQAALLASAVARMLGLPLVIGVLVRRRATVPQTSKDHDQRRRNVSRAFAVRRLDRIRGRRVLLVDDVMTTGATVDECARVLLRAGARRVDVLTLARVM